MRRLKNLFVLTSLLILTACDTGPRSSSGFRLPDGDAAIGKQVFISLDCVSCHTVDGMELPAPLQPGPVRVTLGGDVTNVKTYGELVSSVINPSHKITRNYPEEQVTKNGESLMLIYNEEMTVQQLIDLVAFLQSQYKVVVPDFTYPPF